MVFKEDEFRAILKEEEMGGVETRSEPRLMEGGRLRQRMGGIRRSWRKTSRTRPIDEPIARGESD